MEELSTRDVKQINEALKACELSLKEFSSTPLFEPIPTRKKEPVVISGLFACYGSYDDHKEKFLPGCFAKCLEGVESVPLLFKHNPNWLIGKAYNFQKTDQGMLFYGLLDDSPMGRDMKRLIDADVIDSVSPGVKYYPDDNPARNSGYRDLIELSALVEISLVLNPSGHASLLTTAKKQHKDYQFDLYFERIDKFWNVKSLLESDEIRDFIHENGGGVLMKSFKQVNNEIRTG